MISFGPVRSRRFGFSLGINNIASRKICTYSCIYCQIGLTRHFSSDREPFYEPEQVFENVRTHLVKIGENNRPDILTFVANGEPTLDINLGKEIEFLKKLQIPVAVITNASLIYDTRVQADLMNADWVSLKIDAVDKQIWEQINQPYKNGIFDQIMIGLKDFSKAYKGILLTETMLVKNVNDSEPHIEEVAKFIVGLHPHLAYLSVPIRPPAFNNVSPPSNESLQRAWLQNNKCGIETAFLNAFEGADTAITGNVIDDILNITAVHPLRDDSMAELLKKNHASDNVIESLISQKVIKKQEFEGRFYYVRNYK